MFQTCKSCIFNHKLFDFSNLQSSCQPIQFSLKKEEYHHWKVFFQNIFYDNLSHKLHYKKQSILVFYTLNITFKSLKCICFMYLLHPYLIYLLFIHFIIKAHRFPIKHLIFNHFHLIMKQHYPNQIHFFFFLSVLKFYFLVSKQLFLSQD